MRTYDHRPTITMEEIMNERPIPLEKKQRIVEIAGELMELILLEIEEGDYAKEYKEFTPQERVFLFQALADGFSDTDE